MSLKLRKRFNIVFYGTLIISFLSIIIPLLWMIISIESKFQISIWYIFYANVYVLIPIIILSLIGVLIFNFKEFGILRGTEKSSLNILIVILSISLVYAGTNELKERGNRIPVSFKNNSSIAIKYIKLHGRNALTEFDSLASQDDTTVVFRGREIIRNTDNDYENEVTLIYKMDSIWYRQPILKGVGRWFEFNGPFEIIFNGPDSVQFEYIADD